MAQRVATVFYNCNDHMMTSMGDVDGYDSSGSHLNQTFTNVRRVCWDVNLTNLGNRQWWRNLRPGRRARTVRRRRSRRSARAGPRNDGGQVQLDQREQQTRPSTTPTPAETYDAGADKATRYQHCLVDNGDDTIFQPHAATFNRNGEARQVPVRSPTDR